MEQERATEAHEGVLESLSEELVSEKLGKSLSFRASAARTWSGYSGSPNPS